MYSTQLAAVQDEEIQEGQVLGGPDLATRGLVMTDLGEVIRISEAGRSQDTEQYIFVTR